MNLHKDPQSSDKYHKALVTYTTELPFYIQNSHTRNRLLFFNSSKSESSFAKRNQIRRETRPKSTPG